MPSEIERLYREHRAGLVRLVERELHDPHEAEDVVQTAFLDAQRALERGTVPDNPRAWLAAIALNAGRRLRRRSLNAEPLEDYAIQETAGMSEIRAALTSLPKEQRTAVLYRDVLGLSYGETAEQMGTSVNAVTMLLYRGRQRLRETLGVASGGVGLWRWLKQSAPQAAVVKGAAVVVATAGLATGGIVAAGRAAQAVAPIRTDTTALPAARPGSLTAAAGTPRAAFTHGSNGRHAKAIGGSELDRASAPTAGAGEDASPGVGRSSTAAAVAPSLPLAILRVPTVALPKLSIPTVAATVTLATPITTATLTASVGTTATVTTPITTITVPVP